MSRSRRSTLSDREVFEFNLSQEDADDKAHHLNKSDDMFYQELLRLAVSTDNDEILDILHKEEEKEFKIEGLLTRKLIADEVNDNREDGRIHRHRLRVRFREAYNTLYQEEMTKLKEKTHFMMSLNLREELEKLSFRNRLLLYNRQRRIICPSLKNAADFPTLSMSMPTCKLNFSLAHCEDVPLYDLVRESIRGFTYV